MHTYLESDNQLVITLTCDDLERFGLTYQSIDYTSAISRSAINLLLADAARKTGFTRNGEKLLIEVFPRYDKGCILRFTNYSPKRFRPVESSEYIYEFSDSDSLMCAMEQFFTAGISGGSLYENESKYRLICPSPLHQAAEYCKVIGKSKTAAAFTREHWRLICNNPAAKIGGAMAKRI